MEHSATRLVFDRSALFTDQKLVAELTINSSIRKVPKDEVIMSPGRDVVYIPIVLEGSLRIMRQDEEGREVFLYHLAPGQTCAMSLNCCQAGKKSMVRAVAEEETTLLQIPAHLVEELLRFPEWRNFINATYASRFTELLQVIDLIAFNQMDKQLLHYLQERAKAARSAVLHITHQEIADELHTHREAISRLLRSMELKGMVRLGRSTIEIL